MERKSTYSFSESLRVKWSHTDIHSLTHTHTVKLLLKVDFFLALFKMFIKRWKVVFVLLYKIRYSHSNKKFIIK